MVVHLTTDQNGVILNHVTVIPKVVPIVLNFLYQKNGLFVGMILEIAMIRSEKFSSSFLILLENVICDKKVLFTTYLGNLFIDKEFTVSI